MLTTRCCRKFPAPPCAAALCNSPLPSPSSRPPWLALTLPRTGTPLCHGRRPHTLPGLPGLAVTLAGCSALRAALRLILQEALHVLHLTSADTAWCQIPG